MKAAMAAALLLLAGCGERAEPANEGASAEQIERVSTPANTVEEDSAAAIAIQPLQAGDVEWSGGCHFARQGKLLVATGGPDAVARIGGALRHFVQTAPMDASGIFLEDRQLSISIGRADPRGEAAVLRITNRRTQAQQSWAGSWSCRP